MRPWTGSSQTTQPSALLQADAIHMRSGVVRSVSSSTPRPGCSAYSRPSMEILLNLWDELDDLVGACRHIATSVALEAAAVARPLVALVASVPLGWLWSLK